MKFKSIIAFTAFAAAAFTAFAAETVLDINGAFKGSPIPTGWAQNRPGNWDKDGKFTIKRIPEIEKTALAFESNGKKMHLYTRTGIKVKKGDSIEVKFMAKGKGNGFVGLYNYPAGSLNGQGFKVSEDWEEISKKYVISSDKIKEVRIVFGLQNGGNVEYMDFTAKHITK